MIKKTTHLIQIEATGKKLVNDYLKRRKETVIEILLEFRPDLIRQENLSNLFPIVDLDEKITEFVKKYTNGQIAFRGIWRKVWQYRLHGIGCELTHIHTKEHFNWDIGDPSTFYLTEFISHLEWRCLYESNKPNVATLLNLLKNYNLDVENFVRKLEREKVIHEIKPYEWKLSAQ
jgi:uncharacterized protein DUF6896